MAPPSQPRMKRSTLTDVARVVLPAGIVSTSGPSVITTAAAVGFTLDWWQEAIVKLSFARQKDGSFASDTIGMSIPRQAGKTYLVAAMAFAWCLIRPGATIAWTAHHNKVMLETFDSLRALAMQDKLAPHVAKINRSAENRSISFTNGSRIVMAARESGALRGVAKVSILVLDEAQILTDSALSDLLPTQNRAESPLTFMMGTPPRPKDPGEVFTQQRDQALQALREGERLDLATWIEFSADEDAETDDLKQLRKANPSYPKHTPLRVIRKLRRSLTEDHFRREALGIWDDRSTPEVIPGGIWANCLEADSVAATKLVLGIDMNPERTGASVALAGLRDDGLVHVELDESRAGTAWVVDWVSARCRKNPIAAVVVDAKGPASSLIPEFKKLRIRTVVTNTDDMANACAGFFDATHDGRLRHIGQPQLTGSLHSARKRSIGDRWAWNRKSQDSDITPIVAATLAHWGAESPRVRATSRERRKGRVMSW